MSRIILILSLFGLLNGDERDDFNLPVAFYKISFATATVDTIISKFGINCLIDILFYKDTDRYSDCGLTISPTNGRINIEYGSGKLRFLFLSRSDMGVPGEIIYRHPQFGYMTKFKLQSIEINHQSEHKFGKLNRTISSYKISDIISSYGQPEKVIPEHIFKIYSYPRPEFKRQYELWFNDSTAVLHYVVIKPLTSAKQSPENKK